jgi:hypothetical protein
VPKNWPRQASRRQTTSRCLPLVKIKLPDSRTGTCSALLLSKENYPQANPHLNESHSSFSSPARRGKLARFIPNSKLFLHFG